MSSSSRKNVQLGTGSEKLGSVTRIPVQVSELCSCSSVTQTCDLNCCTNKICWNNYLNNL